MNMGGWIIMSLAVGGMTLLTGWCVAKVLMTPGASSHLHSQIDIKTPDLDDDR